MLFSKQLTSAKRSQRLTARAIASAVGASPRTVENWLQGRTIPPAWVQKMVLSKLKAD